MISPQIGLKNNENKLFIFNIFPCLLASYLRYKLSSYASTSLSSAEHLSYIVNSATVNERLGMYSYIHVITFLSPAAQKALDGRYCKPGGAGPPPVRPSVCLSVRHV